MIVKTIKVLKLNLEVVCSVVKFKSFTLNLKIAFRSTVSELDETGSIESVILNYYQLNFQRVIISYTHTLTPINTKFEIR